MLRSMIAAAMALVLLSSAAEARRHHRHHHHRHHHHRATLAPAADLFGTSTVVSTARSYIGAGAVFGRRSLWCATFMNYVLRKTGHSGTGSDMAASFANYGQRVTGPQVGAIAVMRRGRRGGHVGVVSGIDAQGNPIIISGNHRRRVAETVYPRSRIYAYVLPR